MTRLHHSRRRSDIVKNGDLIDEGHNQRGRGCLCEVARGGGAVWLHLIQ